MEIPTFIENYQTEEFMLCDAIINRFHEITDVQYKGLTDKEKMDMGFMIGAKTNGGDVNRTDYSIDFHAIRDPLNIDMHNVLSKYIKMYADKYPAFANMPCLSQNMKVQRTPPKGGFHRWHCEHSPNDSSSYRNLTWTLYLNDIPEGEGETEFLEYGVKVQPKKGLLCFFPSAFTHTHRGNPVYSCDKYIATGWYYLT